MSTRGASVYNSSAAKRASRSKLRRIEVCVNSHAVPVQQRCDGAIAVGAKYARPIGREAVEHFGIRMAERIIRSHGNCRKAWMDVVDKWLGVRGLAPVMRNLQK